MSLSTNVSNLATRIATEVKALRTLVNGNVADLSALDTTAKTNLVLAINEIKGALDTAATDIAALETEDTAINGKIGTLSSLTTTAKNNLVAAINELQTEINNIDVSGQVAALIDDATTSTSKVWSSSKTSSEISSAVSALVDGAPALLDTLNELAAAIGDDSNYAATMTTALGTKQDKVSGVSDTEIGYLANVSSDIQGQIDNKLNIGINLTYISGVDVDLNPSSGDVFTYDPAVGGWTQSSTATAVNLPATTSIGNVSSTEISYLDGVTSSIQTQLNAKASAANVGDTTVNYVTTFEAGLV